MHSVVVVVVVVIVVVVVVHGALIVVVCADLIVIFVCFKWLQEAELKKRLLKPAYSPQSEDERFHFSETQDQIGR